MRNEFTIHINKKISLHLPLVHTKRFSYYSFNLLGMTSWNRLLGEHLHEIIKKNTKDNLIDAIITVESKAIGLAQVVSELLGIEHCIVVRKTCKSYMKNPNSVQSQSVISGEGNYWIDKNEVINLKGKNILILDDVISTGGTIKAIYSLLEKTHLRPTLIACVLTEGIKWTSYEGIDVISCGHIPIIERNEIHD